MSDQHRTAWEMIWTRAAFIARSALGTPDDQRRALWLAHVGEFGQMLRLAIPKSDAQRFQAIVTEKFPRP